MGFVEILQQEDNEEDEWYPRRWANQAVSVIMAYNEMQREIRLPKNFRPIDHDEVIRLRFYVLRFVRLYIVHQVRSSFVLIIKWIELHV